MLDIRAITVIITSLMAYALSASSEAALPSGSAKNVSNLAARRGLANLQVVTSAMSRPNVRLYERVPHKRQLENVAKLNFDEHLKLKQLQLTNIDMNPDDTPGYYDESDQYQLRMREIQNRHIQVNHILCMGFKAIRKLRAAKTDNAWNNARNEQLALWKKQQAEVKNASQQLKAKIAEAAVSSRADKATLAEQKRVIGSLEEISEQLSKNPRIFFTSDVFTQVIDRGKEQNFHQDVIEGVASNVQWASDFLQTKGPNDFSFFLDIYRTIWLKHQEHLKMIHDPVMGKTNARVYKLLAILGKHPQLFAKNSTPAHQAKIIEQHASFHSEMLALMQRLHIDLQHSSAAKEVSIIDQYKVDRQKLFERHQEKRGKGELIDRIRIDLINDMQHGLEQELVGIKLPAVNSAQDLVAVANYPFVPDAKNAALACGLVATGIVLYKYKVLYTISKFTMAGLRILGAAIAGS